MSKFHVIHGEVVVGYGKGDDAERKTFKSGDSFDMSEEDAIPLLEAGTIGKGLKLKEGEAAPTTNTLVADAPPDTDAQRQSASDGAPEGSQDPKGAAKEFRASVAPHKGR